MRHAVRAAKVLAHDPGIPRWLRWLFAFGLLPIPLFFDELALVIATTLMFAFHRAAVLRAWRTTSGSS